MIDFSHEQSVYLYPWGKNAMIDKLAHSPESTRGRILDAALNLFSDKGYNDAQLDEIAAESETPKSSIYFLFPTKERIFLALAEKFADLIERRVLEAIERHDSPRAKVEAALGACLEAFDRYRRPAKVMLIHAAGMGTVFEERRLDIIERFARLIRIYLDEAIAAGEIEEIDTDVIACAWVASVYHMTMHWLYNGEPEPERLASALASMLLRSVNYRAV